MPAVLYDDLIRVDPERQSFRVARRAFTDSSILEREHERIFSSCWLYLGHESQLRRPGDFLTTYMGADPVILCRDGD